MSTAAKHLASDSPLVDPQDDLLGRADFAQHLAQAILKLDATDGFVFALNGPWGSGKTFRAPLPGRSAGGAAAGRCDALQSLVVLGA